MKIIKSTLIFSLFLGILSCNAQKNIQNSKTNAEISVKEGGKWNERKYEGGTFKNVQSLELDPRHTDHSFDIRFEGPGWESNKIAYRLYLDWRNAIDIFGKTTDKMILPLVGLDGFESYHLKQDWGSDILKVGKGQGIGSILRYQNNEMLYFKKVEKTSVNVENSAKQSVVNINYKGWETLNDKIDLTTKLEIFPNERFTKATVTSSKAISGICTGIVKVKELELLKKTSTNQKWAYIATYGDQSMFQDNLGMAVFYETSSVEKLADGPFDHLIVFKPTTQPIHYYFLAAWVNEPNGIKTKEEFVKYLNEKLSVLNANNKM